MFFLLLFLSVYSKIICLNYFLYQNMHTAQYYTMILRLESVVSIASLKCNAIYVYNGTTDLYCKNVVAFKTCRFLMQKEMQKTGPKKCSFRLIKNAFITISLSCSFFEKDTRYKRNNGLCPHCCG